MNKRLGLTNPLIPVEFVFEGRMIATTDENGQVVIVGDLTLDEAKRALVWLIENGTAKHGGIL